MVLLTLMNSDLFRYLYSVLPSWSLLRDKFAVHLYEKKRKRPLRFELISWIVALRSFSVTLISCWSRDCYRHGRLRACFSRCGSFDQGNAKGARHDHRRTRGRTVSVTQTFLRVMAGAPCGSENRVGCPADSVQHAWGASDTFSDFYWCYFWSMSGIMLIRAQGC